MWKTFFNFIKIFSLDNHLKAIIIFLTCDNCYFKRVNQLIATDQKIYYHKTERIQKFIEASTSLIEYDLRSLLPLFELELKRMLSKPDNSLF